MLIEISFLRFSIIFDELFQEVSLNELLNFFFEGKVFISVVPS